MEKLTVHSIYFSPARTTKKITQAVAEAISDKVFRHDITQGLADEIEFFEDEIVVIGVPSYLGRVPAFAAKALQKIKANATPVIFVCVYGNRDFEDTLIELNDICVECGFNVVSAGAFIGQHSIFPAVASGRPDVNDLEMARSFGKKSLDFISIKTEAPLQVKGNRPYREGKPVPFRPKGNSKCDKCGACVTHCPTGAISKDNPRKTDKEKCISCAGCIHICPQKARSFAGMFYKILSPKFIEKNSARKEIELFYPELITT